MRQRCRGAPPACRPPPRRRASGRRGRRLAGDRRRGRRLAGDRRRGRHDSGGLAPPLTTQAAQLAARWAQHRGSLRLARRGTPVVPLPPPAARCAAAEQPQDVDAQPGCRIPQRTHRAQEPRCCTGHWRRGGCRCRRGRTPRRAGRAGRTLGTAPLARPPGWHTRGARAPPATRGGGGAGRGGWGGSASRRGRRRRWALADPPPPTPQASTCNHRPHPRARQPPSCKQEGRYDDVPWLHSGWGEVGGVLPCCSRERQRPPGAGACQPLRRRGAPAGGHPRRAPQAQGEHTVSAAPPPHDAPVPALRPRGTGAGAGALTRHHRPQEERQGEGGHHQQGAYAVRRS